MLISYFSLFYTKDPYIKPHQKKNIINYQYSGADLGLTYNYVLSPSANWFVHYVPTCISANVVTLSGFVMNVAMNIILVVCFGFDLKGPLSPWFLYLLGIEYFLYHFLDTLDGKQARKLGTASSLGMLVDHGVDCTTSFLSNVFM